MPQWIIVVKNEGTEVPSVIGPFDTVAKAVEFGESVEGFVSEVSLATLTPVPEAYK